MTVYDKSALNSTLLEFKKMAMFEGYVIEGPESRGMSGDTPLHIAAMDGRLDILGIFIPFVENINIQGDIGNTALHYAVMWDHSEAAWLLLKHGADINFQNDYADTPMSLMNGRDCFEKIVQEYS